LPPWNTQAAMTRTVFADAAYRVATINPRDQWHPKAKTLTKRLTGTPLAATQVILTEVLNHFSAFGPIMRRKAVGAMDAIVADPLVAIVPQSEASFQDGHVLHRGRPDKVYSLTDRVTMEETRRRGVTEILSGDRHFTQEGFTVLF
ncbi:MAG: type II toxin-antitoxin system VapC family toxin, partial [Isosphaeraceae bacterium]